jgi:hypothetical protein
MVFRYPAVHLVAENATAKRIAMDQQYWHGALSTLLNCEGAVGRDYEELPSRGAHAATPL